jgi:hypothetical protein
LTPSTKEPAPIEVSAIPSATSNTYEEILRATRWWVLYGTGGFAVICILIGAVEALFGR